jgi:hypothetical protein
MNHENQLRANFYRYYDPVALYQFINRIQSMSEDARRGLPSFLGEGVHFQSFEHGAGEFIMAVNIAKSAFLRRGDLDVRRWKDAMDIARSIDQVDLIPPMEVLSIGDSLAVIMPKGDEVPRAKGRKLEAKLLDTARALGKAGLVLDDYPQLREVAGIPFIIDWSDLSFVS